MCRCKYAVLSVESTYRQCVPVDLDPVKFRLFRDFEEVDSASTDAAGADYYAVVDQMRQAVRAGAVPWARHPEMIAYADVCYWAMRKLEYRFACRAIADLESKS